MNFIQELNLFNRHFSDQCWWACSNEEIHQRNLSFTANTISLYRSYLFNTNCCIVLINIDCSTHHQQPASIYTACLQVQHLHNHKPSQAMSYQHRNVLSFIPTSDTFQPPSVSHQTSIHYITCIIMDQFISPRNTKCISTVVPDADSIPSRWESLISLEQSNLQSDDTAAMSRPISPDRFSCPHLDSQTPSWFHRSNEISDHLQFLSRH